MSGYFRLTGHAETDILYRNMLARVASFDRLTNQVNGIEMKQYPARFLSVCVIVTSLWSAGAVSQPAPKPVTLDEVKRESLSERVNLTGNTIAWRSAELSVRVDGLVTDLRVDEGSVVAAGDPILVLDSRLAEHDVESARARLREARARHEDTIRVRDELRRLQQSRHASETELESAIAQVDIAAASLSGARAALARAEEVVARHGLAAPFAGMVVTKHVELGEWVTRDQAAVVLVALDKLRIRAIVPQRDYPRVETGAKAAIRFDAFPERTFEGRVEARIARGDDRSRTFPLLIDLPNPDRLLAPGMSARVEVELTGNHHEVVTVPRDAVVTKSDGRREVWRVRTEDGDSKAEPVRIEIGRANGDRVEVLSGQLETGDRIVLLGNERLRPGDRVEPRTAQPTNSASTAATE